MKKILSVLLVGLLLLAGCGSDKKEDGNTNNGGGDTTSTLKVGTAVVSSVNVADPADKDGKFEANVTYATVLLEGDKIKDVKIDTAQNEITVGADGPKEFVAKDSKGILKEDYGMVKNGNSTLEWYQQIEKLQAFMIGKTSAEIADPSTDSDVASSVSIKTDGYVAAVQKAIANAVDVEGAVKIGQASSASGKAEDGKLEISTTVAGSAVDADGKIVFAFIDTAQMKGTVTDSVVAWDSQAKTKGELKEEYGMKKAGSSLEWNEQVEVLTKYAIGKTASELSGAEADADVKSSVSITINYLIATLEAAVADAK